MIKEAQCWMNIAKNIFLFGRMINNVECCRAAHEAATRVRNLANGVKELEQHTENKE